MKRLTPQPTQRWPIYTPSIEQVRQRPNTRRWTDHDILVAFLIGALLCAILTSALALAFLALI